MASGLFYVGLLPHVGVYGFSEVWVTDSLVRGCSSGFVLCCLFHADSVSVFPQVLVRVRFAPSVAVFAFLSTRALDPSLSPLPRWSLHGLSGFSSVDILFLLSDFGVLHLPFSSLFSLCILVRVGV